MIYSDILGTIGATPIVRLDRLVSRHGICGRIFAKIEFYSPGLSKKDRIAKYIIEKAERSGELLPGQTVIEQTSGNTGIGLAAVCAVKGYPFVAVMSEGNSVERIAMIRQFGARVHLVAQSPGSKKGSVGAEDMKLVEREFERLAEELCAFKVGQFYNEDNALAHYYTTAKEIIADVPDVHAFCDFLGTGGSFEGVARALLEHNSAIKCFAVEPKNRNHVIQGGGYFKTPPFASAGTSSGVISVSDEEAIFWMRELSALEAIAGGISSGANIAACVKYLRENPGKSVVCLINDPSLKYMSAGFMKDFLVEKKN